VGCGGCEQVVVGVGKFLLSPLGCVVLFFIRLV
jgi:hypothetical protein